MQTDLLIREMFVCDLGKGFFESLDALSPSNLHAVDAAGIFEARENAGMKTYVAIVPASGRIIGTATLLLEQKFIHGGGIVGHIEDVAVRADQQHSGIGAALVNHILGACREMGCYKVILDCEDDTVPFYEKLGFSLWERAMRMDLQ